MKANILIPNVGRRGYLVDYIKEIPNYTGKVFVSDCSSTASGLYGKNDGYFILPKPVDDEKKYVQELLALCLKEDIKIIIPVIDPEIYILSKYVEFFAEKEIFLLVSNRTVLDICYNKLTMNLFLKENGFCIPLTFESMDDFKIALKEESIQFPVIIKPIYGSGSASTYQVNSLNKLEALFQNDMIIQEMIVGKEYGIDVFNDLTKNPVRCVVKEKIAMRSGETDKSKTVIDSEISKTMRKLGEKLGHIGNLDSDVIRKDDLIYILDLNPRFGGGYPATHASGVNLLELVLNLYEKKEIKADFYTYEENLLIMKQIAIITKKI